MRPPTRLDPGLVRPGLPMVGRDVPTMLYADPRDGGNGAYVVNGDKADTSQWRWRVAQLNQGGVNAILPAANPVTNAPTPVDVIVDFSSQAAATGDSEVLSFWAKTADGGEFAVKPQLGPPFNQYLSNVWIGQNLVFGTSQLPGYLASPLLTFANSDLNFHAQSTSGSLGGPQRTLQAGVFCRTHDDSGCEEAGDERRKVWLEEMKGYSPCWVGPEDRLNPNLTGFCVQIFPGQTVDLRFPAPGNEDFLAAWLLDDTTSGTGFEPQLKVIVWEEDTREDLIDDPDGIMLRDFVACPTVTVPGFPYGGVIRAMSLKSPRGGWTHQVRRNSAIMMRLISSDPSSIFYRGAFHGWSVGFPEPSGRQYAPRIDRSKMIPSEAANIKGGLGR
jgi:hypothetical protein